MIQPWLLVVLATLCLTNAVYSSEIVVLQKPSYLTYTTTNSLKLSEFKDLLLSTSGVTLDKPLIWTGLKSTNSLSVPKVTLVFVVKDKSVTDGNAPTIKIDEDSTSFDLYATIDSFVGDNIDRVAKLVDGIPSDLSTELPRNCENEETSMLLFFKVDGAVSKSEIEKTLATIRNACGAKDDLLAYVLATQAQLAPKRIARAAKQAKLAKAAPINRNIVNGAIFYSDQYPAIFQLLFWTSLILGITVFGVAYMTCNMDPGLDTVIYRMTSQRIKKDQ